MRIKITERLLKYEFAHKLQSFEISVEDFSSNYDIFLPVFNTFTFDTEEYYLDFNYKVNHARAMKNLYHHCSLIQRFEIATHDVEAFN